MPHAKRKQQQGVSQMQYKNARAEYHNMWATSIVKKAKEGFCNAQVTCSVQTPV